MSFHVFIDHLYVFFGEMSAHFLTGLFVFLITELYELFLYFGDQPNPLSVASFVIIFSRSEHCLFILFIQFPLLCKSFLF